MRNRIAVGGLIILIHLVAFLASGDDLGGASVLLCSSSWATVCTADEICESGPPWGWNIPQFVEVDLEGKTLSTTEASGENRTTPVEVLRREDGVIFIQGRELGRAFSVVVSEDTGRQSAVIAGQDLTISIFGACTPVRTGR
jgi:hypothetical protein